MKASYYGGIPGYSFLISQVYPTKADLEADFASATCPVHYGEYALVSCEDREIKNGHYTAPSAPDYSLRNRPDNGQLYMRGNDGSPEYIGNIMGPAGVGSDIVLDNYDAILPDYVAGDPRSSKGISDAATEMIPGKDGSIYNESIEWVSVSMTAPGADVPVARIGFKVPYPVFEFDNNVTKLAADQVPTIEEIYDQDADGNDIKHNFYHKYHLELPVGDMGDSLTDLQLIKNDPSRTDLIYPDGMTSSDYGKMIFAYQKCEYVNGVKVPDPNWYCAGSADFIDGLEYSPETGKITYLTNNGNSGIVNPDGANRDNSIFSVKKIIFVQDRTSSYDRHILMQWESNDRTIKYYGLSEDVVRYQEEMWVDLGAVDTTTKVGKYYADLTDGIDDGSGPIFPDAIGLTRTKFLTWLNDASNPTIFTDGLKGIGYEGYGIVYGATDSVDADGNVVKEYYIYNKDYLDLGRDGWVCVGPFGGTGGSGSGGDTSIAYDIVGINSAKVDGGTAIVRTPNPYKVTYYATENEYTLEIDATDIYAVTGNQVDLSSTSDNYKLNIFCNIAEVVVLERKFVSSTTSNLLTIKILVTDGAAAPLDVVKLSFTVCS